MGGDVRPMSMVRVIDRGERVANIISEGKALTFQTGLEHALVKLPNGQRAIVSGGEHGIDFAEGQITRLFGHTHPQRGVPPSRADEIATFYYGQRRQHVFDPYGNVWRVRPKDPAQ
jgi:hypothetical protein